MEKSPREEMAVCGGQDCGKSEPRGGSLCAGATHSTAVCERPSCGIGISVFVFLSRLRFLDVLGMGIF